MVEERVSRGQRKADNENIFSFCKLLCSRSPHRIYRLMVFGFVKTGRNNHRRILDVDAPTLLHQGWKHRSDGKAGCLSVDHRKNASFGDVFYVI